MPSGCRGTAVARRRSARCPSPPRSAPARSRDSSRGHRRSTRTRVSSAAGAPAPACEAALRAVVAARAGMAHFDAVRQAPGCRRCPSARRCIWARSCGAISARPTGWTSPRSAPRSTCLAGWRGCAGRSAGRCWSRSRSRPRPPRRRCRWANTRCAASPHLAPSSPCRTGERLGWVQVASPTSHRP